MVATGFIVASVVINSELKRKEKQGLLFPREEYITIGKPASFLDLLINFVVGFGFGFKFLGLVVNKPADISPQAYIFSSEGSLIGGLLLAMLLTGLNLEKTYSQF